MNENENTNNNSIGEALKEINHDRGGSIRRRIRYDEETGDFVITEDDAPLTESQQDATPFAEEGFA